MMSVLFYSPVVWMEDADKEEVDFEKLEDQYHVVKAETNT